jgi:hypothetical protein
MKQIIWAVVLMGGFVAAPSLAAHPLPSGEFVGTGTWKSPDGSSGGYDVSTRIEGATLTSNYEYAVEGGRRTESATIELVAKDSAVFEVRNDKGEVVGKGFYLEAECSYRAEFGSIAVEETIRFDHGVLYKFGSKCGPGFQVIWSETLKAR